MIICAFAITRGMFPQSKPVDLAFNNMSSRFINKRLITPEGQCFDIEAGTPSGSVWTA